MTDRPWVVHGLAFLLFGVGSGCAARVPVPGTAVRDFALAVERRDLDAAYRMTSAGFRARVSLLQFRESMTAPGARDVLAPMKTAAASVATAQVPLSPDAAVRLVLEEGHWRIDAVPPDPWGQASPEAALRTLVAAVRTQRFDVVLRLAPVRVRSGLTEAAVRAFWRGVEGGRRFDVVAALAAQRPMVVTEGEVAHLPYGNGQEIRFVLEDGAWRIDNL